MKARAVVLVEDSKLEMQELEVPKLGTEEALLRVEANGLCGSDIEQFKGGYAKAGLAPYPMVPGHEPIGIIEEIGADAAAAWGVKIGDRVAIEPILTCGLCPRCMTGSSHLCRRRSLTLSGEVSKMAGYGIMPVQGRYGLWGGYGEYMHLLPRTIVHKIPKSMPLELAALYQLLASGIRWSVEMPQTAIGDNVLILGSGQRGLGSVVACREAGAAKIIVTGLARDRHKLDLALALGATDVIVVDLENTVERVLAITGGQGVDTAVDVAPNATDPIVHALEVLRPGGTLVMAGLKHGSPPVLHTDTLIYNEIKVQGVNAQSFDAYDRSIKMLESNKYDLGRIHTHSFGLDKAEEAIRTLAGEYPDRKAINISLVPGL